MNRREDKPSPLCLARDAAMACRAGVVYILKDSCFAEIAAFLFPDVEPDPAIIAKARLSNVHTPMSHGQPDGPTRLGRCQQALQALNIGATGFRRRFLWATPPGAGFAMPNHRQAGRTAGSTPDGAGVRTKAPEAVASSPHFHIPTGVPQLEPDRFHPYSRAPAQITG